MSSSIEEEFSPPEWATKEEVIKAARHYINYWKIEARTRNYQWLRAMEEREKAEEINRFLISFAQKEGLIVDVDKKPYSARWAGRDAK